MSREIEIPNLKTVEEAKMVFEEHIDEMFGDSFVFYVQRKEEEEGLIGIKGEEDILKDDFQIYNTHEVLAVGSECKRAKVGKRVVLDPMMAGSVRPIVIGDCMFNVISDRAILTTVK